MDFKKLLSQLDHLNEADVKHKGTYGTSYQGDEDDDKKTAPASTEKRGRGRPKKAGGAADTSAKYSGAKDLQSMIVGNVPKDSKELKNLPKTKNKLSDEEPKKKKSTTESLKDWIAAIDEQRMLAEAGLAVQPIGKPGQNFLIKDPANPSASAITTSDPAVVDAAKKGTLSMQKPGAAPASGSGSQVSAMQEGEDEGKPGKNFAKIAKSAAKRYGSKEAGERVAGAVRAKLMKQGKIKEAAAPTHDGDAGAGLGAGRSNYMLEAIAEGMDPKKKAILAALIDEFRDAVDPEYDAYDYYQDDDHKNPRDSEEIIAQIRSEFGDHVADQVESGAYKMHFGRDNHDDGGYYDPLAWKKPVDRITKAGKMYKQDSDFRKNTIKSRYDLHDKSAIESMTESSEQEKPIKKSDWFNPTDMRSPEKQKAAYLAHMAYMADKKKNKNIKNQDMSESKTAKRDNRAEAAGKKVTKDLEYDMKHKGKDDNKAERAGKKVTKDIEYDEKKTPSMAHIKKMCKDGKTVAQICKMHPNCNQAELKKMVADCKKKMVAEGMDQRLEAARAEGRAHGLRGHAHCGNNYDDMEEARCYHEGYKVGLDECYGQMPIQGYVGEESDQGIMDTMDYDAELDEMDKTAYMKQQAIKTPGNTFHAFGQTMHDSDVLDEFAFESLDRQLNALLNEDSVSEGMTVSISKGQENSPDSVSINASDAEADSLLSFVKQAGLGIFGGDDHGSMQDAMVTTEPSTASSDAIEVVDDHDGMLSLIRKMAGQGAAHDHSAHDHSSEDYADEEENCNECGMAYESCGCDESDEMVDEMQTPYQLMANVAEDTPVQANADEVEETGDEEQANAEINAAASNIGGATNEDDSMDDEDDSMDDEEEEEEGGYDAEGNQQFGGPYDAGGHYVGGYRGYDDYIKDRELDEEEDELEESYANGADDTFESDIDFMTNIISGGANKRKSTGQTTIPVVSTQLNRLGNPMKESTDLLTQWKKLSGI